MSEQLARFVFPEGHPRHSEDFVVPGGYLRFASGVLEVPAKDAAAAARIVCAYFGAVREEAPSAPAAPAPADAPQAAAIEAVITEHAPALELLSAEAGAPVPESATLESEPQPFPVASQAEAVAARESARAKKAK
jgi:hypothetical protein